MKITNKFNLPEPFVRAIINDPYDRGDSDFSPTSLAEPPRASALKLKFDGELEVDASSRVASIIGQGAHKIAERAARDIDICEKRYFSEFLVDGNLYKISAQIDLYEGDTWALYDWKSTKAFAFSKKAGSGLKPEWISQMNICAELMARNDLLVKSLHIIALLKDWEERKAKSGDHPPTEVMSVELPLWDRENTVRYIEDRIRAHVAAREKLPLCSSLENWQGRKCSRWCDVSSVCLQYQSSLKTGVME